MGSYQSHRKTKFTCLLHGQKLFLPPGALLKSIFHCTSPVLFVPGVGLGKGSKLPNFSVTNCNALIGIIKPVSLLQLAS